MVEESLYFSKTDINLLDFIKELSKMQTFPSGYYYHLWIKILNSLFIKISSHLKIIRNLFNNMRFCLNPMKSYLLNNYKILEINAIMKKNTNKL